jgi:hypothetical protein
MMRRRRAVSRRLIAAVALAALAAPAAAEQVVLEPTKDNTIFSQSESLSNGIGVGLFAGRVGALGGGATRRALLAFDVAGAIPVGATITSAQLRLRLTLSNTSAKAFTLHRVTADWGEANSNSNVMGGGMGAAARPGDATWGFRFFNTERWGTGGGDFVASTSATQTVAGSLTFHTWGSTPQMVADVQVWLDTPSSNFGWLLRGDESTSATSKRFASGETTTANNRPKLTIDFEPPIGAATATPTVTVAPTATQTSTAPASATATRTHTAPGTSTASVAPTGTATATGISTATSTHTPVETPSSAATSSITPTATGELATATASRTPSATAIATATAVATATDSAPPSVTPTDTPSAISCVGDCDGDGEVAINELILGVSIALGNQPLDACPAFDPSGNGRVEINELINAVGNALNGCP